MWPRRIGRRRGQRVAGGLMRRDLGFLYRSVLRLWGTKTGLFGAHEDRPGSPAWGTRVYVYLLVRECSNSCRSGYLQDLESVLIPDADP